MKANGIHNLTETMYTMFNHLKHELRGKSFYQVIEELVASLMRMSTVAITCIYFPGRLKFPGTNQLIYISHVANELKSFNNIFHLHNAQLFHYVGYSLESRGVYFRGKTVASSI